MGSPVGTKQHRITKAIHWHYCTEKTDDEIADELGVSRQKVQEYIREGPSEEVEQALTHREKQVRLVAFEELRSQLQAAGERSRTAEKPVKVWTDENGNVNVRKKTDEDGEVVERVPVNADVDLLPDEEARFYARTEVRDILEQLTDLVGAGEAEQHHVEVDTSLSEGEKELLSEMLDRDPQ